MTEANPSEQGSPLVNKGARRFWWMAAGVVTALVLLIAYVIFRYDCAPPQDAWMRPAPFAADNGPDSFPAFVKRSKAALDSAARERGKLPEGVRKVEAAHLEEAKAFLEKHHAALEDWSAFFATHQRPFNHPDGDEKINFSSDCAYLELTQNGANLIAMRARVLALEGKVEEAVDQSLLLLRIGGQLSREGGFLIQWLVAITLQQIGRTTLESIADLHPFDDATLTRVEQAFATTEMTPRHFKETMRVEYLSFKHSLAEMTKSPKTTMAVFEASSLPAWAGLTLKHNLTLEHLLELERPVFDACDRDWRDVYQAGADSFGRFQAQQEQPMLRYLSANIGGNMMLAQVWQLEETLFEKNERAAAFHRQVILVVAMRRFQMDHGSLPKDLQELCPKYLTSVPLDPYDNAPMRWNSKTAVVYSVGKDLVDGGGAVSMPVSSRDKDVGMFYWWRGIK